jgi:3-deoxy-D-manno-octulosonic acid kinase
MSKDGQRIATATGVMLADPNGLGNEHLNAGESLFDPNFWSARNEIAAVAAGRGSAWFIGPAPHRWVLRHYRRGGFIANISQDRYFWAGEDRVRAFAEWRLLEYLTQRNLQVPKPVAAFYRRSGPTYRCDLITLRIPRAQPLSAVLAAAPAPAPAPAAAVKWREIGRAIARLHRLGVDHADLNAHNILVGHSIDGGVSGVSILDFDRGRLRAPGKWAAANLARLQRSLTKISASLPQDRFTAANWNELMAGYEAG